MRQLSLPAAVVIVAVTAAGCGGSNTSTPTPTGPTTPTPPAGSTTITIGADGRVSPATVTIARGGRVTMVNNHTRSHEMASDPHPEHSQCPELNTWGFLRTGEQRTSDNLNTARTCGFHDHNEPSNAGLQGRVIIQ